MIAAQALAMRDLTQSLVDGQLSLGAWQGAMMQAVKSVHLVGLATANGGWNQLDQADFGWAGQRIRSQYGYLRDFATAVASGRQPLNGMMLVRVEMYAHAARATHRAAIERAAKERGLEQAKSNLGACDHCSLCLSEAAKGWQPLGSLIPVGSRTCLSRCHCWFSFRTVAPAA